MAVKPILLLGNPELYRTCTSVVNSELTLVRDVVADLHDTLLDFRKKYGRGRAIAAPQIRVSKRIVYMLIDEPIVFINPELLNFSGDKIELWDDCMSFPELMVKVERAKECEIHYKDLSWNDMEMKLENDLSELLQHECDHLDGILATERAVDKKSIMIRSEWEKIYR